MASWGNGLSNAGGFNTIIVNDLSGSFSSEIANQRAVDIAILNCISSGTNGNGKVGLTTFGGDPWMQNAASLAGFPTQTSYRASPYQPYLASAYTGTLALATAANIGTMTRFINNTLSYCGNGSMQPCSGSNVSSGLYSAIKQLQAQNIANPSSNIILISDGVPNATARTYSADDGAIPTPSASINTTYGWNGCTSGTNACTDTSFWNATQAWAAYAGSLGINVSTVYYSGSTPDATSIATYTAMLASLVKNNGTALVAPNPSSIDVTFAKFCSSMGAAVKKVS